MNIINSPVSDNQDAADELPSVPLWTVALSFAAIILVVTGLVAAVIYGLPR